MSISSGRNAAFQSCRAAVAPGQFVLTETGSRLALENDFIRRLTSSTCVRHPVVTGIGDDGAVIEVQDARQIVVTDMLLDQVHFDLKTTSPRLVGRKAMLVNLSDLAAMASRPTSAFVSLAIPRNGIQDVNQFLDELYGGIQDCCDRWGFCVAGGDTNSWAGPFAINVCLTGRPMHSAIPLRSGAKPGDHIFVTGPLGGSLPSGRHLSFEPRFEAADWLLSHGFVTAMMDVSDGLATDLPRLAEASEVGAILELSSIPVHPDVDPRRSAEDRIHAALCDGEDFELLFTVPGDLIASFRKSEPPFLPCYIGQITSAPGVVLRHPNGTLQPLQFSGWQHQL